MTAVQCKRTWSCLKSTSLKKELHCFDHTENNLQPEQVVAFSKDHSRTKPHMLDDILEHFKALALVETNIRAKRNIVLYCLL